MLGELTGLDRTSRAASPSRVTGSKFGSTMTWMTDETTRLAVSVQSTALVTTR
jgi:hypothetical protein